MYPDLETFFPVAEETRLFLLSCLWGVPVGILYDIFRIIRALLPHNKAAVFIEDILFFLVYAVMFMTFCALFARSVARFYYAVGNALGFAVYFCTVGKIVVGAIRTVSGAVKKLLSTAFGIASKAAMFIMHSFARLAGLLFRRSAKNALGDEKKQNIT